MIFYKVEEKKTFIIGIPKTEKKDSEEAAKNVF
jgi:hypothetical protein